MRIAKRLSACRLYNSIEGKGTAGCLIFLLVAAAAVAVGVRVGPPYYANKSLDADVKTEASRAGARFYDNETVLRNVLDLARRNEVRISRENVKLERFAGQLFITIEYSTPVDLFVTEYDFKFKIKASSFIGRL